MSTGINDLEDALRASRKRVVHLISAASVIAVLVSVQIVRGASSSLVDIAKVSLWFVACGVLGVLARLWYRARLKAEVKLHEAIDRQLPIRRVEVTRLTISFIPFGYDVDILVADGANVPMHLGFGAWSPAAAERIASSVQSHVVVPQPRAELPVLPRAVVVAPRKSEIGDTHGGS